ncbi:helix-turn-helix transcriptional regulator [Pseudomonas sp. N040]|uniref:helix-turn-helix transcriptional regulator n=1 Tax=Pseudomonas sp. N040 TaxID=2785325 RepID=UPI0018A2B388|nr:WYL domain-containing protein [Pseudomonas sp. N040]MBF7731114.1 WYL domain-containing protein [Pseudomonas sp. N040]MBW7014757.1 WYL domain-containing protein [Pseudomonas sp. N040]
MPAANSRSTLSRQWELLKLLPSRLPGYTVQMLVEKLADGGYEISKRTVERDLNELSLLFPLQCNNKGMPYGWYWTPGSPSDLPGVTLSEALTLQLVENSLRPLLPAGILKSLQPRFAQARQKLDALTAQMPTARWIDKIASVQPELNLIAPEIDEELLEVIQQALLDDQQITSTYFAAFTNKTRALTLNPLALILRGSITYLAATVEPYTDVRLFALHRFKQVEMLEKPVNRPSDFDLKTYIKSGALQFSQGDVIQLKARINSALLNLLSETPISPDMKITKVDGGHELTATVLDSWQLHWWLLSQADAIEVLEPLGLRAEIFRKLQAASAMYESV